MKTARNHTAEEIQNNLNWELTTLIPDISEYFHIPEKTPQYRGWKYFNTNRNHEWIRMQSLQFLRAENGGSFWYYNWSA